MISDSVVRTVYYKYFDPKEALVTDGVVNRALVGSAALKDVKRGQFISTIADTKNENQYAVFYSKLGIEDQIGKGYDSVY